MEVCDGFSNQHDSDEEFELNLEKELELELNNKLLGKNNLHFNKKSDEGHANVINTKTRVLLSDTEKLNNIIERVNSIENNVETLHDKLDNLINILSIVDKKNDIALNILEHDIKEDCEKMSSHINFVETIYDNVKYPLNFLTDKINRLRIMQNNESVGEEDFFPTFKLGC